MSITERMPSRLEAKANEWAALQPAASGPSPMEGLASSLPAAESMTDIFLPSQTGKRRWPTTSRARPEGESQPAGQVAVMALVRASMRTISLLSSRLSKTEPWPSATANSGLPGSGMVAMTALEVVLMTEMSWERPLNAQTVFVAGS